MPSHVQIQLLSIVIIWLLGIAGSTGSLTAQERRALDQKISLTLENETLKQALHKIEAASEVQFTYNDNDLPADQLNNDFHKRSVRHILDKLLKKYALDYQLRGNYIIILPSEEQEAAAPLRYTISGFARDAETGEALIGCTIFAQGTSYGCYANAYGFYSLNLPQDQYQLHFSYIGYQTKTVQVTLEKPMKMNAELNLLEAELPDVVVSSKLNYPLLQSAGMGRSKIDPADVQLSPALFGEPDILRNIQLLPGVSSTGEGGGYSVRGSSSDHNLILLDEAPIYNPSHMLGIFSIFNADAIRSVELIKGDIPAEHRGRLASILDIRMKEGNNKRFHGIGGIGLLAARLTLEGQLAKGKASYMASVRRTYLDLLIKPASKNLKQGDDLYFLDINLKANVQLGPNDRLYFSAYNGKDVFEANENGINWGNKTGTLRWNHLFGDKLFMNATLVGSRYDFLSTTDLEPLFNEQLEVDSTDRLKNNITDVTLKADFQWYRRPGSTIRFGANLMSHSFLPAAIVSSEEDSMNDENLRKDAVETGLYWSHELMVKDKLQLEYGLHFSGFSALGTGNFVFDYNDQYQRSDSTFYKSGALIKQYTGLEPRLSVNWQFADRQALKASYTHTRQYIQQLRSAFINNPATIWVPASARIRPQQANQFSVGYVRALGQNWELNSELYFRHLRHQISYRDGALLGLAPRDVESLLVFGKTKGYGMELMLRKNSGKLRGWLAYNWSRTFNYFPDIHEGKRFRSEQDRPHDFALVAIYDISNKLIFAANWVYLSGKLVTLPAGKIQLFGQLVDYYEERNNYRMPAHHRLDVSLTLRRYGKKNRQSNWNFAIYNLYARKNPNFVYFERGSQQKSHEVTQLTLVRMVPSVSYNFEF